MALPTHHLPRSTTIERYENGQRLILRSDANHGNGRDHIVCSRIESELNCNFVDVLNE
jgi:hypothetical protein